jgi:hypothetical protein
LVAPSKPLATDDESAINFVKEMLAGDPTYAINFDRIQWDNKINRYVILEYLLCDEKQFANSITPYTSHPNKYFYKNSQKFVSLWRFSNEFNAKLFLINYSKKGTKFEDEILLMDVQKVNQQNYPYVETINTKLTRSQFSTWLRELNSRGRR